MKVKIIHPTSTDVDKKNPTVARWRLLGTEYVIAHRNSLDGNGEIATVTVTVNIMMYCSRQYTNRGWNQRGSLFFFNLSHCYAE